MNHPRNVLIDTNIWLDFFLQNRPQTSISATLIQACIHANIQLMMAASSFKDIDYIMRSALNARFMHDESTVVATAASNIIPRIIVSCLQDLLSLATILSMDQHICEQALQLRETHHDIEDNMLLATAYQANADMLVTRDQQLRKHFPDICIGPEAAYKTITA
jgi:putative PIN family toxin of toxin-antitoxin system